MVSMSNFLPSAVFHKLLAKCISKWQIVEQNGRKQIFCDVCKFNLDYQRHYKLTVFYIKHAIHAKIISYVDKVRPQPAVCKLVHEFMIKNLRNILTSMGFSDEFRTCIQCPQFSPIASGGYLDMEVMDNQEFVTCDECQFSHVMERIRICRNCVSGHSMDGRLDNQTFEDYWKDIYMIMNDIEQSLGIKGYQDALAKRKDQILSPKEAKSIKTNFNAFQAEVLSAVETVTVKMRNLQALVEGHA